MAVVLKRPSAAADLDEIWLYIALESSSARATQFLRRIEQKLKLLAGNPYMGRARNDLAAGLRSFPVGNYVILYRPIENGIEVVRVVHGSRDIEDMFH